MLPSVWRIRWKTLGIVMSLLMLMWAGMCAVMYVFQERIIFHPQPIAQERVDWLAGTYAHVEEMTIQVSEDVRIHGWLVRNGTTPPDPLLIYFGGNAEEVSHLVDSVSSFDQWSVLLMNYRGYGFSEGTPGEEAFYHDALEIYDFMRETYGLEGDRTAVMGRSMGTGVAVYLAHERELSHVVLVSPFDSLVRVSRDRYPFAPVEWLLNHCFDNIGRAPDINTPLLTLIAAEDTIIPPRHSLELEEAWAGVATSYTFDDRHHNNIQTSPEYWSFIRDFLKDVTE